MDSHGGPEQAQVEVQRRRADWAIGWLVSVLLVGVGINLLSNAVTGSPWAWIAPVLFVLVAAATLIPQGLLRRERHGRQRWALLLAVALTIGYLVAVGWATTTSWSLPVLLLQAFLLWATAVLVCWQTLREDIDLHAAVWGVTMLLFGVAVLLIAVVALGRGDTLFGVAFLVLGVAFLVLGVAFLSGGVTLGGVAFLLAGVAFLLAGVAVLGRGDTLFGVAFLVLGVAVLLGVVVLLSRGDTLGGVAFLLAGVAVLLGMVAVLLGGGALLSRGDTLFGVAVLLGVVACLVFGVALLLFGVAFLRGGVTLFGVAVLLGVVACLVFGVALLRRSHENAADGGGRSAWSRLLSWLTTDRFQATSTAEPALPESAAAQTAAEADVDRQAVSPRPADPKDSSQNPSPDTPV